MLGKYIFGQGFATGFFMFEKGKGTMITATQFPVLQLDWPSPSFIVLAKRLLPVRETGWGRSSSPNIQEWAGAPGMSFVQIPVEALSHEALEGLIEEFVTRDGTDYGAEERTLEDKKSAVRRQLERGEVVIVFDPETQTSNIILKDELLAERI